MHWTATYAVEVYARHHTKGQSFREAITHGHTWKVALEFRSVELDAHSQAVSRGRVSEFLYDLKDAWEAATLNEFFDPWDNPTPEFLAQQVYWRALEHGLQPSVVYVSDGIMTATYTEVG